MTDEVQTEDIVVSRRLPHCRSFDRQALCCGDNETPERPDDDDDDDDDGRPVGENRVILGLWQSAMWATQMPGFACPI